MLFADLKGSMELLADRDPEEARKLLETAETNQEIIKDWLIEQRTVDAAVTPIWSFEPIAVPVQVGFVDVGKAVLISGCGVVRVGSIRLSPATARRRPRRARTSPGVE